MARTRSLLLNGALVALSLGLGCGAVELAARLVAGRGAKPEPGGRPISRYSPTLGWDKPPGGEMRITRDEYDILIQINSKGLRGPERDYEKPPATRRVLILGDSFAEGYYVDEAASARGALEGLLRDGAPCQRYEVINGGTAGYSTDQELLFFEAEGQRYHPDLVVVFFYYNDLYYNTTGIGTGGKPKPYFDLDGTRLRPRNEPVPRPPEESRGDRVRPWRGSVALRLLSDRTAGSPGVNRFLAGLGLVEPVSDEPFREFWPWGLGHREEIEDMWRRTAVLLKTLRESVESRGARLAVLYVPARFEIDEEALAEADRQMGLRKNPDRIVKRLQATCDAIGIRLVDPREALRLPQAQGRRAYFRNDGHWNEVGNAIAARALLPLVRDLLPCPSGR